MIVLVPAFEPDERLIDLVRRLRHHDIVIVDDGSGPAYHQVFAAVRERGADVVTLPQNRGKGCALKVGFAHVRDRHPGQGVVCADSDGQHTPADIEAVAARLAETDAAMVLGARRFTGDVPARSRLGNAATRLAFGLVTGERLVDTQTGLRGYPAKMLPWLIAVDGDRFEYELRLLLRAVREGLPIEEVDIATIYLDHNASSHFRPVRDSARIYGPLLAFSASSLLGFAVDAVLLFALASLTGAVAASAVLARLVSATLNYRINRRWVFASQVSRRTSAVRYAVLAACLLAANVVLLEAFTLLTGSLVAAKIGTELLLFGASFVAQSRLVFARPAARLRRAVGARLSARS
ncbi:MAG: bifunctional glycosyltransferase family 2/GtrA family protein [Hamadaea sp.]|nr:bifunctional glycosyltransferase family 2/GtrA family protein [Hamadaea sp.]